MPAARLLLALAVLLTTDVPSVCAQDDPTYTSDPVLATVGIVPIRESDVEFFMVSRKIPEAQRPLVRDVILRRLVERQHIRNHLAGQNIEAPEGEIDDAVTTVRNVIKRSGDDPDAILKRLGFTEERLRSEVAFTIEWRLYLDRVITNETLRNFYDQHRAEVDGTKVRLRQIFRKAKTNAEAATETEFLSGVAKQIENDELTFEEAARQHSQSPSAKQGGDLGQVPYSGVVPETLTAVAFTLQPGEIGGPVRSKSGVHLVTIDAVDPGDFSLEDVRQTVRDRVARDIWNRIIEAAEAAE